MNCCSRLKLTSVNVGGLLLIPNIHGSFMFINIYGLQQSTDDKQCCIQDRGGFPCVLQYSCFPWFPLLSQRGKRFERIRMAHCIDDGDMHAVTCIRKLDLKNVWTYCNLQLFKIKFLWWCAIFLVATQFWNLCWHKKYFTRNLTWNLNLNN